MFFLAKLPCRIQVGMALLTSPTSAKTPRCCSHITNPSILLDVVQWSGELWSVRKPVSTTQARYQECLFIVERLIYDIQVAARGTRYHCRWVNIVRRSNAYKDRNTDLISRLFARQWKDASWHRLLRLLSWNLAMLISIVRRYTPCITYLTYPHISL